MATYQRTTKGRRITTLNANNLEVEKRVCDIPKDWNNKELGNSEVLSISLTDTDGKTHTFYFRDNEIEDFKAKIGEACL